MKERVALVTGGSRGIGRLVVEELVRQQWRVAFTWRTDEAAARAVESATVGSAAGYHLDLADRKRPADLVAEVEEQVGPLSGLVNNAGMHQGQLLALTSDEVWDRVLDLNLGGVFRCCRAVVPRMVRRRQGSIVNVASLAALHGIKGLSAYAAAKAGVLALSRCLAREVGSRGIRVNAVILGFVATDMTARLPPAVKDHLRRDECLPQGTDPGAAARAIAFLLSDAASAITGQGLVVDSGSSC